MLVAASVVAGARLLAAADDTVQVWAAAPDLGAGQRVEDDLVAERVRFADEAALDGYFTVDDELPADLELTRSVAAGELLPRAAVGTPDESGLVEVPIAVEPEQVPPSVAPGAVVDVYVVGADQCRRRRARRQAPPPEGPALAGATVVDAPELAESFGTSGKRQLVLAVPEADAPAFFALLGSYDAPSSPWSAAAGRMVVVLLVAAGAAWESAALATLSGRRDVVVLKRCVDVDDLLATATSGQADVAVVGLDAPGFDLAAVDHLGEHGVRPVAVARRRSLEARCGPARIGVRATVARR